MNVPDAANNISSYGAGLPVSINPQKAVENVGGQVSLDVDDKFKSDDGKVDRPLSHKEAKALRMLKRKGKREVSDVKSRDSINRALAGSSLFPLNLFACVAGFCDSMGRSPEELKAHYEGQYADTKKFFKEHSSEAENMKHLSQVDYGIYEKVTGKGVLGKAVDKIKKALTPLPKGTPEDEKAGKEVITKDEKEMLGKIKAGTRHELLKHIMGGDIAEFGPGLLLAGGALLAAASIFGLGGPSVAGFLLGTGIFTGGVASGISKFKNNLEYKHAIDNRWEKTFEKLPEEQSKKVYHDEMWLHGSNQGKLNFWWDFEKNMQNRERLF